MTPLVSTEWLAARLDEPGLRIADVRFYLDPRRDARQAYLSGHIPGAVFFDMETELSAPGGGRGRPAGRHPWPPPDQVARVLGAAGIGEGVRVVAYDDQAGGVAARLWFLLRVHGHEDVAILDGGLAKWQAEARPVETAIQTPAPVVFVPRLQADRIVTKAELVRDEPNRLLLDARVPERYRGESEPIDPRAGHVPGALNAPFSGNLTSDAVPVFLPASALRERYAALGADRAEPIVYCGSGVTACHDLFALHLAGLGGRLYAGSWSEWSADPALPAEVGAEPRQRPRR